MFPSHDQGGPDIITTFDEGYAGMNTADNEHGAFYFSDSKDVGDDYSRESFKRKYQDNPEQLVEDGFATEDEVSQHEVDGDVYDWVEEMAEENLRVVDAYVSMQNQLIVDADYKNLRELEKIFNIQDAIGFIKGKSVNEIPENIYDDIKYNESDINDYRDEIKERAS